LTYSAFCPEEFNNKMLAVLLSFDKHIAIRKIIAVGMKAAAARVGRTLNNFIITFYIKSDDLIFYIPQLSF
jgi:hypothetical protein